MTLHKEDATTDVDAVQVWSAKELEGEFSLMLKAYKDKETEFNWEARDKSITRLRGILRGNATEAPYLEVLVQCMRQMVDGIIKAVESLRTQLAVNALSLVSDIGVYMGRHVDAYIIEQLLGCMIRCASLTKKMVASASLEATKIFLKHTHFHAKFMNQLNFSMNEKNIQVRLYSVIYTKTLLQTHAHHEKTRALMDRTSSTDHFDSIISRGLNDATPIVKETCREAFWIFWEYWRDRGDHILKQLPAVQQKQLEKSRISAKNTTHNKNVHSPTISPRASSSLGRHSISPSTSTNSNGSDHLKRSMSPRAVSPHLRSSYGSPPPASISSQLQQQVPSSSTSPTPTLRKTRVPTLNRKKSSVGLIKRKAHFLTLLKSDDLFQKNEGLAQLAKKLESYPYNPNTIQPIQLDVPNGPPIDGETLKSIVTNLWDDCYEVLSSWDGITCIIMRLFTFEEYIPKLILDTNADESTRRTDTDIAKQQFASLAYTRAKLYLNIEKPNLVDTLFTSLIQYGNFVNSSVKPVSSNKKDITRLPANRRKLTKQFLEWLDELVTPLIGLQEDIDVEAEAYKGVPQEYLDTNTMHTSEWFESDDNIRQCLAILLPLITTSTSGTMWHAPLVTFMKHIRLLKQRLFESITATYDDYSVNKICRVLGIHIRLEPPVNAVSPQVQVTDTFDEQPPQQVNDTTDQVVPKQEQHLAPKPQFTEPEPTQFTEPEQRNADDRLSIIEPPIADDEILFEDPPSLITSPTIDNKPLLGKLSIKERNSILDRDEFTPIEYTSQPAAGENNINLVPEEKEQDFFTKVEEIKQEDKEPEVEQIQEQVQFAQGLMEEEPVNLHKSGNTDPPSDILYTNEDARTVPTADSSPQLQSPTQQTPHKQLQLPVSIPNPEKFPEPVHVPFFAPEKVNFPNPVFKHNVRTNIAMTTTASTTTNGTSPAARNLKDKTILLYALIDKLKTSSVDHQNTFRKLSRLFKDVPIRRRWDQGGIEENGSETWAGAQGDAGNFVETVQAILPHLVDNDKHILSALECVRQLAITQAGLFRFYERKVDDQGRTLESQLMEKLLLIRSNENPTICIAAEDALDAVLGTLNPPTAFEMLMAFIIHRCFILTTCDISSESRYHPLGSAFMYLGKWVKEINDTFYIDEWLGKGGVNAFFKGINHPLIGIRKSCVEAVVAFHEVIGDDIYLFLGDLREDQLNLIRHYVAKTLKKKASLRNLRDNSQF